MAQIKELLNRILKEPYLKNMRQNIHDSIEECYRAASVDHNNANMEVSMARGEHETLAKRFDKLDEIQAQTNAQLSHVENKTSSFVGVEIFGVVGDGVSDDTSKLQKAIHYCEVNKVKLLLDKKIYLTGPLVIEDAVFIDGNGATLKAKASSNSEWVLKLSNKGAVGSVVQNLIIDGNKANTLSELNGLVIYSQGWEDTQLRLTNIEVKNCTRHGFFVTGGYSNSSIREARFDELVASDNNRCGFYADSMTDSFIQNSTFLRNGTHGIFLNTTGSVKIIDSKCYFNGKELNEDIAIKRLPSDCFVKISDASPVSSKTYYTRSGSGLHHDPYVFTEFKGSAFEGTNYYCLNGIYKNHGNGLRLKNCTGTTVTSCEFQDNAGDGIFGNSCTLTIFSNVSVDSNGLSWGDDFTINSYESLGLTQYFYGLYMDSCLFNNVHGYANNYRYNTQGYIQRASCYFYKSDNTDVQLVSRLQKESIRYELINPTLSQFMENGKTEKFELPLSTINVSAGCELINDNWSGSKIILDGNKVHFKLVIKKPGGFSTTNDEKPITFTGSIKPILSYIPTYALGANYADTMDGLATVCHIDSNGGFHIKAKDSDMKFITICGEFIRK